jgi:hypothetical protein
MAPNEPQTFPPSIWNWVAAIASAALRIPQSRTAAAPVNAPEPSWSICNGNRGMG